MTVQQELQPLQHDNNESILSDLTLSFFDYNTSELDHLSDSLGMHLSINNNNLNNNGYNRKQHCNDVIKEEHESDNNDEGQFRHYHPNYQEQQRQLTMNDDDNEDERSERNRNTAQYRIHRASEILQSSLRASVLLSSNDYPDFEKSTESTYTTTTAVSVSNNMDMNKLKRELEESQLRIKELETSYRILQEASQQALHEFSQLKEDFDRESVIKSQQELTIISLLKEKGNLLSKKEIDKAAILRVELERACKEMAEYRDRIVNNIGQTVAHSSLLKDYQKALKLQIKSLIQERDFLQIQTKDLAKCRDEIIREMVLLNTKNAELTTMNNDLSRLALEKEEANSSSNNSNSPSTSPPLSPSHSSALTPTTADYHAAQLRPRKNSNASSIMSKMSYRRSFIATQSPGSLFRLKKKGSAMFGKFSPNNYSLTGAAVSTNNNGSSNNGSNSRYLKHELASSSLTRQDDENATSAIYNDNMYNYSTQSLNIPTTTVSTSCEAGDGTLGRSATPNSLNNNISHRKYNSKNSTITSSSQKISSSSYAGHGKMSASSTTSTDIYHHSFRLTSFLRPVKCGVCGDKIWGRSEYRCEHCGYSSHSRCLNQISESCPQAAPSLSSLSPSATNSNSELVTAITTSDYSTSSALYDNASSIMTPETSSISSQLTTANDAKSLPASKKSFSEVSMFGIELSERAQLENRDVPLIVEECIKEVEKRGLSYEGIYRKSGGAAQIRSVQLAFDQGEKVNLSNEEQYNDICAITSVLKQYFRELPNPLFTYELYENFIKISTMDHGDNKLNAFIEVLSMLPTAHQATLMFLFNHLVKVHMHSEINRMNIKNLSMVFAPTIMRHKDPSRDFLDISYKNATIEYILLHTAELFPYISSFRKPSAAVSPT
ncbi:hypothetical protein BDF20DRAFT_603021 [Mycotypha africana]|uniref:uncharacterized protein n=1 Tax=Mycotypha africana TaxID=64632 RepID=UPI0023006C1C|nr:uncharacterized protein BDF20DRAFT_603021 [Mycotypha africana]KAI8975385.1 hypothetical protein BDF20DRAFT_603021 [Mycotypha africana]